MAGPRKDAASILARHPWWVVAAAIAAAVVLLAAFNSMRGDVITIRAVRVSRGNIRSVISTNGKVEPLGNFEAHSPVPTTVKRVLVKEGDHVKRGQLLLELDAAEAHTSAARALSQLKSAEADISAVTAGGTHEEVLTTDAQLVKARGERDGAKRNLDALERLLNHGAASVGEVKDAENQFQSAQASVDLLEKKQKARYSTPEVAKVQAQKGEAQASLEAAQDVLNKSNIRAPFDGVVYALSVRQGNFVAAGDLVLQMADLSRVRVRAYVDEPDVGRLVPGAQIEVTWDALPGRTWQSTLTSVPASVKLYGTRNVGEITTSLENADLKLLPNINVTVQVITGEHANVLLVPREAVHMDDSQPYVYLVAGDELRRQAVQTSIFNFTQAEVTKGLSDDKMVALGSVNNKPMHDGQAVKVVP